MKTWQAELGVVTVLLGAIVIFRHAPMIEWLASAAVLASFAHGQVADRLAEREGIRASLANDKRTDFTECWKWAHRYYWAKELLWTAFFWATGAWAALAGALIFIAYPVWRKQWRKYSPIDRESEGAS